MQILQMPNMITLSYLRHDRHILSWRDLHNTHEDNHLAGAKSHPSCKINPSQARLFKFVGFGKATFKTKHYKYFKTAGSRVKGKQQTQPRNILPVRSSLDDEFRSSRNIAIGLHRRYRNVVERGCGEKLREFIKAGVTAYAVGCTDEGLRKELISLKASAVEAEGMPGSGSSTRLKAKITSEEIEECILWLSIIFITILCTPQPTIVRWSNTPPVSAETRLQWNGFCALIANAYYTRGMACKRRPQSCERGSDQAVSLGQQDMQNMHPDHKHSIFKQQLRCICNASIRAPCKDIAVGANGSNRNGRRASSSCWLDETGLCNVRGGQSTMAEGLRLWLV